MEKDRLERRVRIVEEGQTSKGEWYTYDTDFKKLDVVVC